MKFEKPEIRIFDTAVFIDPSEYEKAYLFVDSDRREKADSFKLQKDKLLSLGAGYLLKKTLNEFGVDAISIEYNREGKPCLKNRGDLFFNLSHSGKYAALVLYDNEVGIDIQKISNASEKLIRRVSTDKECEYLMNLPKEKRNEEFARLWTTKESYLKFRGIGLAASLTELEVNLRGELSLSINGKREAVSFIEYPLSGYKLTICY